MGNTEKLFAAVDLNDLNDLNGHRQIRILAAARGITIKVEIHYSS